MLPEDHDLGGTIRSTTPSDTISRIASLRTECGITRIANVTGLDTIGVPVWMAVRPLAWSLTVSQGKGISDELAYISAAMEGIELHCAERYVPVGERCALANAHRSPDHLSPLDLPLRRTERLGENLLAAWIPVKGLGSGAMRLAPRELVCRDSRPRKSANPGVFYSTSNGLASGNTRDEAIVHGLCEVIERDQLAFWKFRRHPDDGGEPSKLDLATIDDPHCREVIRRIETAGLKLAIWHCSREIAVPAFTCAVWDDGSATIHPQRAAGHGAHPYKRIALSRAVTEALQSRLTHISGARDDMFWQRYRAVLPTETARNRRLLSAAQAETAAVDYRAIAEAPPLAGFAATRDWLVRQVTPVTGHDVFAFDLAPPEFPIAVVKIIAPGLEIANQLAAFTPGRRLARAWAERAA